MARDQKWWLLALGVWWIVGMVNAWAGEPTAPLLRDGGHEVTVQEYRQMLLTLPLKIPYLRGKIAGAGITVTRYYEREDAS